MMTCKIIFLSWIVFFGNIVLSLSLAYLIWIGSSLYFSEYSFSLLTFEFNLTKVHIAIYFLFFSWRSTEKHIRWVKELFFFFCNFSWIKNDTCQFFCRVLWRFTILVCNYWTSFTILLSTTTHFWSNFGFIESVFISEVFYRRFFQVLTDFRKKSSCGFRLNRYRFSSGCHHTLSLFSIFGLKISGRSFSIFRITAYR